MKLLIKNMVSNRCVMAVKLVLNNLNINYVDVNLGEAELKTALPDTKHDQLKKALLTIGLELIVDKKSMLIEKIKNSILELVHYTDEPVTKKYSCFLNPPKALVF